MNRACGFAGLTAAAMICAFAAIPGAAIAAAPSAATPATAARAPAGAAGTAAGPSGAAGAPAPPVDRRKENKAVVRRYLVDVLGGARPEALADLVSKTYVDRTPGAPVERGPAAVRNAQSKIHEVFAKVDYMVQELVAEDDRVVARYVVQATPRMKSALPVEPVVINGITIFKLAGGKIQETWIMNDQLNMLRQLGFALAPAGPPPAATPPAAAPPSPGAGPPPQV